MTKYPLVNMEGSNFGDAINPVLFEYLSGYRPVHQNIGYKYKSYMMVGSILNKATPKTTVWGAGIAQQHGNIGLKCDVRAVRGPISRKFVEENGITCPELYGDPVLLMPRYYNPTVSKKYRLGIVPHILDYHLVDCSADDVLIIDLHKPYNEVIDMICSCDSVVSSSLHGLIAADAYGIPSKWVEFSDIVIGRGLKFHDYYQSIGYMNEIPLNLRNNNISIKKMLTEVSKHDIQLDMDALYDACPFKK